MSLHWLLFIIGFIILYVFVNVYLGVRCYQVWGKYIAPQLRWLYIAGFIFGASLFFIARLPIWSYHSNINFIINLLGAYWLVLIYYGFLALLIIDSIRFINSRFKWCPKLQGVKPTLIGSGVLLIIGFLLIAGTVNARTPIVRHYDIEIEKVAPGIQELHVVLVSDIHIGSIIGLARLDELIKEINGLSPDMVVFAGDIVDESVYYGLAENMKQKLSDLTPSMGIYAVLGNHEYIGGYTERIIQAYKDSGIVVLRDDYAEVDHQVILIGRDDLSSIRVTGKPRKALTEIIKPLDKTKPLLLLDHQPADLQEAEQAGIDLEMAGHTHRGQFFPNQFITAQMYELDWGYLKKNSFSTVVSCGYGTWGPPIRIGNRPEIVSITLHFKQH